MKTDCLTILRAATLSFTLAGAVAVFTGSAALAAGGEGPHIERQDWSYNGFFGKYNKAQLQRGFGIYKEVCSSCHGLKLLSYRNLVQKGGPEFSKEEALAIAKEATVSDGFDDSGDPKERPGKLSDRFQSPFSNDQMARSANNGALPPDLSVIAKARTYHRHVPWYTEPYYWLYDMATAYEEKGSDYLYALLTGYKDAPSDMTMGDGMHYNEVFPGHQIAMAAPLSSEMVDYEDGTKPTLEQHAKDITAFLAWASEPHLNARKDLGKRVMIYLAILALLLYLAKLSVWARVKH
ncbi:MAG: hypothetical protein DHS20C08_01960 [Rhodomicrobium sp.]|nr:MAG: hypothetical protein DHS20C08_01960 [Rhodomicrobium sp.]